MASFILLFTLGILFGIGVILGINKLAEKRFGGKDVLEKSLKELEVDFKQLDQKTFRSICGNRSNAKHP